MAHDLLEQNGLYANFTSVPRGTCGALAGVYRRSADVVPSRLFADTTTRAVTVCTPSCYVDLRISRDRAAVPSRAALAALSLEALGELVCATHCFGGVATVDARTQRCTRHIGIDWQPTPRLRANEFRFDPRWAEGGWVEWSTELDGAGQARYVEHWRTLRDSRDGPFLALRRAPSAEHPEDALFLVAGDHFVYISGRDRSSALPRVTPGTDGHPADRGSIRPLVAAAVAAGDRAALLRMLSLECHYGRCNATEVGIGEEFRRLAGGHPEAGVEVLPWTIALSTAPWREGTTLAKFVGALGRSVALSGATDGSVGGYQQIGALPGSLRDDTGAEWVLYEAEGIATAAALRAHLRAVRTPPPQRNGGLPASDAEFALRAAVDDWAAAASPATPAAHAASSSSNGGGGGSPRFSVNAQGRLGELDAEIGTALAQRARDTQRLKEVLAATETKLRAARREIEHRAAVAAAKLETSERTARALAAENAALRLDASAALLQMRAVRSCWREGYVDGRDAEGKLLEGEEATGVAAVGTAGSGSDAGAGEKKKAKVHVNRHGSIFIDAVDVPLPVTIHSGGAKTKKVAVAVSPMRAAARGGGGGGFAPPPTPTTPSGGEGEGGEVDVLALLAGGLGTSPGASGLFERYALTDLHA